MGRLGGGWGPHGGWPELAPEFEAVSSSGSSIAEPYPFLVKLE